VYSHGASYHPIQTGQIKINKYSPFYDLVYSFYDFFFFFLEQKQQRDKIRKEIYKCGIGKRERERKLIKDAFKMMIFLFFLLIIHLLP